MKHSALIRRPTAAIRQEAANDGQIAGPVSMSSLELVEFINASRKEGAAVLRHDHFLAKVPQVLGEAAPNFLGAASYEVNGATRSRPCYRFPKREACLMAMSYSYELQAKVFDRMTALEAAAAPLFRPAATARSSRTRC